MTGPHLEQGADPSARLGPTRGTARRFRRLIAGPPLLTRSDERGTTEMSVADGFVRLGPAIPAGPVVIAVPHAGRDYPPALMAMARVERTVLERLEDLARRRGLPSLSLVAVGGSPGFWLRQGFRERADEALRGKLRSYDDAARYMVKDLAPG